MTYAKLEDGFPEHRKVVGLSDAAFRLYVTALCYSSRNLTDGFIAASVIQRLGGKSKTTMELTAADLFHGVAGPVAGWHVHDYLKHQRSREVVLQQRADSVDRALKSKRNRDGVAAQLRRNPSRQSTEERVQSTEFQPNSSPSARGAREWFEVLTHRAPLKAMSETFKNMDSHGAECLAWAFGESMDKDDPWRYGKRILEACAQEGHGPRNGRSTNLRANQRVVRQSHGRYLGASQRVAGAGVDWDAAAADHERIIAAAQSDPPGAAAEKVGDDV